MISNPTTKPSEPLSGQYCVRCHGLLLTEDGEFERWESATSVQLFDEWDAAKAAAVEASKTNEHQAGCHPEGYFRFLGEMAKGERKARKSQSRDMKHATIIPIDEPFNVRDTDGGRLLWTVKYLVFVPMSETLFHLGFVAQHEQTYLEIICWDYGGGDALQWNGFEIEEPVSAGTE